MVLQVGVGTSTGAQHDRPKRNVPCMALIALELVLPNRELVLIINK